MLQKNWASFMSEPTSTSRTEQTRMPLPPGMTKKGKILRVLLLEDVATDAELMERELLRAQLPVTTRRVETREEFVRALAEFEPDIILSDFTLPQFTALDAIRLLHATPCEAPFILVTGTQSEEVAVQCMKEGVHDYILKTSLKRLPTAVLNAIEKKEAEHGEQHALTALKQSEEHFRSLIENALDIITVLDLDGKIRYASPSVKVLGYRPEELVGKNLLNFVSLDDAQEVRSVFHQVIDVPGQIRRFEFLFKHKDNSWRVIEAIGKCLHPHSENCGVVLNARDISERKEQESAIEKLAAFPRLNPNPIFELTSEGRVSYFNDAAEKMAHNLGKLHPAEILPADATSVVKECLSSGQSNTGREVVIGNRILSWSFFPIIPLQVVHGFATDITERVTLESQLRQSQKMESIGQLAAGVAHDFNNILTLIAGYSGLLLSDETITADSKDSLKQISSAAERAANLTRQLLLFGRKQAMQPQDLNLNELIGDVTKLLRRILGENIILHINYAPELPLVRGDSGMIEQVLMNLAVNARDAMVRGGEITIGTTVAEINEMHVKKNPEARVGTYVCLRVNDSGSGISPEVLPRIFEPFFTTKEVGKGTGLGLATVYGIVKQHSGWIEVLSSLNRGTTFRIFLPVANGFERKPGAPAAAQKVRGGSETVLVVEDEPELRILVRGILHHYGYRVLEAESGPEALPLWEKNIDKVDLLLTDMVMPGNMTGRELAEHMQKRKPGLKVIYTSGYSVDTLGNSFVFKRGVNFLPKPYHPLTLAKIVRDCLDA